MKFTFGIVTSGTQISYDNIFEKIIPSIRNQNVPDYEIIIIGGNSSFTGVPGFKDIVHLTFDESSGEYTAKKNMITKNAKFDNIVYMHDYIEICDGWYDGFKKFSDDWDICMNIIETLDGNRYRDWCAWDDPEINYLNDIHNIVLPSYKYNKKKYMYISGAYWISKKHVMEEEPLNENLGWGDGEDVEWSKRVLPKYNYKMNIHSKVKLLKNKKLSARYIMEIDKKIIMI